MCSFYLYFQKKKNFPPKKDSQMIIATSRICLRGEKKLFFGNDDFVMRNFESSSTLEISSNVKFYD